MIVPEITIVPTGADTNTSPLPVDNHSDRANDRDPKSETIKVPREGGGDTVLRVSEVEDGWLLLDYVEEPSEQVKDSGLAEPALSPDWTKSKADAVIATVNVVGERRTK